MDSTPHPNNGIESQSNTDVDVEKATSERLPIEIRTMVIRKLADDKDYQAMGRVQRTSRDLYLVATPMLYEELGPDSRAICGQLDLRGDPYLVATDETLEYLDLNLSDTHPIECNPINRLLWVYSNIKRLVYRPLDLDECSANHHRDRSLHLYTLKTCKKHASPGADSLFPSLENIMIDLSQLPDLFNLATRNLLPIKRGDRLEVWDVTHEALGSIFALLRGKVGRIHLCVNMGLFPWTNSMSYPVQDLGCTISLVFHAVGTPKLIDYLPAIDITILDIHPSHQSHAGRLALCQELLRCAAKDVGNERPQRPRRIPLPIRRSICGMMNDSAIRGNETQDLERIQSVDGIQTNNGDEGRHQEESTPDGEINISVM